MQNCWQAVFEYFYPEAEEFIVFPVRLVITIAWSVRLMLLRLRLIAICHEQPNDRFCFYCRFGLPKTLS